MENLVKTCSKCKESKDILNFYVHNKFGHRPECKQCTKKNSAKVWKVNKAELTKRNKEWLINNKEKRKKYTKVQNLKRKYGLTLEQYEKLIEQQKNKCKICYIDFSNTYQFDVDHDHRTGKIRGILCSDCNKGIGSLRDDVSILANAIVYLENNK